MHARSSQRGPEEPATSLVFPTYNPGGTLERTWRELMRFLKHEGNGWEVLFVCDGCTDGTPERLEEWIRGQPHYIRVLSYAANRGKGHAVRQGMNAARGAARLFTDVDLAYGFEDILRVAKTLHDGADVVVASRTHSQSTLVLPPAFGRTLPKRAPGTFPP